MKIVIVIFTVVISSPCFTPGVVGNDVTEPHYSGQTTTANMCRQFMENQPVPEESKSSSKKEVKTDFKPVPKPVDTFSTIQREGRNLVDKSNFIRKLIDERGGPPNVYLLTRPRRFGKTVFVTMLKDFLEGQEGLFNGTEIQSRGNNIVEDGDWQPYPVIHLDFYGMRGSKAKDFTSNLRSWLKEIARVNGLPMDGEFWTIGALIREMERKDGLLVSVLIDNYDDPLMTPYTSAAENRLLMDELISFHSQIKTCSTQLRLVFITGVSRLNKIHRAWNGFVTDITHKEDYWSIMGFTWEEVKTNFDRNIAVFASDMGMPRVDIEEQLPKLYGMYKFNDEERKGLLIPGSVCESLTDKKLKVYLPSTPAFSYVVDQMLKRNITVDEFKYVEVSRAYLESNFVDHDEIPEKIPLEIYMWFNGLLTIKKRTSIRDDTLELTYPCQEVEDTFRKCLSAARRPLSQYSNGTLVSNFHYALHSNDFQTVVDYVNHYTFPPVSPSLNKKLETPQDEEFAATDKTYAILKAAFQVNIEEGNKIFRYEDGTTAGDIDLFIPRFEDDGTSYTISMKYEKDAVTALFASIVYVVENPISFRSATSCTDSILLGWNVRRNRKTLQRRVGDWVAVPYREGKIWLNELETDFTKNSETVLRDLMDRIQVRSTNKMKYPRFVPDDIIIRPNETVL